TPPTSWDLRIYGNLGVEYSAGRSRSISTTISDPREHHFTASVKAEANMQVFREGENECLNMWMGILHDTGKQVFWH
ncbi:hypothetical protein BGZ65_004675, partial [Modicella reniformis]